MKPFFAGFCEGECYRVFSYELTRYAALTSLLIVGCATNEPQPSPAQTQLEKKDVREYNKEVEGRVP
jgi:hypothetical protein